MTDELRIVRALVRDAAPLIRASCRFHSLDLQACEEWLKRFGEWEMAKSDAS